MKRILGLKMVANLTFFVMLIGTLVFTFGFGSTIYIARQDVERETDLKVNQSVSLICNYVDGQLQRVEDVAYTLISGTFAATSRSESGDSHVSVDPRTLRIPSEDEVFAMLEKLINANPHICGAAIGFEPFLYRDTRGEYGFAAYVTNVSGHNERLSLGEIHDFRQKEWYTGAASTNAPYWSHPFRETSQGKVVACFSLPLHGHGDRLVGVLALDIDTEAFRLKCDEVAPLDGAEVSLVDSDFRFISHPDDSYIMKSIAEVGRYSTYTSDDSMRFKMLNHQSGQYTVNKGTRNEAMFYFAPIERTGWMVSIECPKTAIYSSVQHMKKATRVIAGISMLFMIICFILLFRRIQSITEKKAGIERDLQIASAIQMGMLPKLYPAFPDRKEIDVYGFLKPARSVGGDLYDYFIKDEKFFFCIGDVSGKGVPASLFMAVIRALFRNVSLHTSDPAEIISSLNTAISDGNTHNMFCTMFLGVLDLRTGHIEYCNAGHNAPIIRRMLPDGGIDVHFATPQINIAVGVFDGFPFVKEETFLKPGDAVFLYTDGVTEAENPSHQLFGDDAAIEALKKARTAGARTAKEFVDYVHDCVVTHAAGTEQSDDITMVVVEYKGLPGNQSVLKMTNSIDEVPRLGEWVAEIGYSLELPDDKVFKLNLALEEAVVNVINYAYPEQEGMPVELRMDADGHNLRFVLDDEGVAFDPTQKEDPDITLSAEDRPIGGLGIMLVREIMKEVRYERKDGHNLLTMTMEL